MNILAATVTTVQIGPFSLQGLMDEDGGFAIAIPQMVDLNLVPPNRSSKQLKALVGIDLPSHKLKTELNSKAINAITLDTFQAVIRALDKKGNPVASGFVDAMLGLSLHQLFADAFGVKFDQEDRQRWLLTRFCTKKDFRWLTDALQSHGFTEPSDYARFVYTFQTHIGIKTGTRDEVDTETLVRLQGVQVRLTTLMECGLSPWEALKRL